MKLGIDFGTTRCVVAAVDDGRYPLASFDIGGTFHEYLPGLVARGPAGLVYGWDAAAAMAEDPESGLRSLKRAVQTLSPDEIVEPFDATALDLVTGLLGRLRRAIVHESNFDIAEDEKLEAMVAVPANASTQQRYLTLEAFRAAGFEVLGLVNEPTAGAIDFAHRHLQTHSARSPKRYVVVYDLGGGTFDASAVSLKERRFDLLASDGIAELGGDDFDALILEAALGQRGCSLSEVPHKQRSSLLERCREAKETLGSASRRLLVELGQDEAGKDDPEAPPIILTTKALYERAEPLVTRTVTVLEGVLEELGAHGIDADDPRQLGAVYLVGGAVAFPPVARTLRARFGKKLKLAPQPHAATAVGLAIAADASAKLHITEAATRCFGVWREADGGRKKVFDPIIDKNHAPPASGSPLVVERRYRPAHRVGLLRFVECARVEDGRPAGDLLPWDEIRFPYDPVLSRKGHQELVDLDLGESALEGTARTDVIEERYTYSADGRIAVRICNTTRGYARDFELSAKRLSRA